MQYVLNHGRKIIYADQCNYTPMRQRHIGFIIRRLVCLQYLVTRRDCYIDLPRSVIIEGELHYICITMHCTCMYQCRETLVIAGASGRVHVARVRGPGLIPTSAI